MSTVCTSKAKRKSFTSRKHCGVPTSACFIYKSTPLAFTDAIGEHRSQRNEKERHFPHRQCKLNPITLCPGQRNWARCLSVFPKSLSSSSVKILNSSNRSWAMWFMSFLIHPGMTSIISISPVVFRPITTHLKGFLLQSLEKSDTFHQWRFKCRINVFVDCWDLSFQAGGYFKSCCSGVWIYFALCMLKTLYLLWHKGTMPGNIGYFSSWYPQ